MSKRISVPEAELKRASKRVREEKNITLDDISEYIDADFRNFVYKGINMSEEVFHKFKELYGREISHKVVDHRNGVSYEKRVGSLEKNNELAEFIGILLGDGNIRDFSTVVEGNNHVTVYRVSVTLNSEEEEIQNRVKELFKRISGREPTTYYSKHSKAVDIYLYSKDFVERLEDVGMQTGNKKENQVGVPEWVKEDESFSKACLRGLVDTDGAIYVRSHDGYRVVQFKNASQTLLNDFEEMCESLGVSTSKGGYRTVQVASQTEVANFIRLIAPIKYKG